MNVKVFRFNPDSGQTGFSDYRLPFGAGHGYTVMSILRYIHENLDPTLSFFSHCVCGRGICGRCAMEINGKMRLACAYVPDSDDLTIKPKNKNYFKDLVCK
jgi:succinate dehydrogenase / fumarate reductase iron-sulfur subunit